MYSREQSAVIRQNFWTRFGKYMSPIPSASGEKVNWVNYKTGIPQLYFRMNASKEEAYIGIEIQQRNPVQSATVLHQFALLRPILEAELEETWIWEQSFLNETGQTISRIYTTLNGVNIFNETDWPAIISFLKPRMLALDKFWAEHKMIFEIIA